MEQTPKRETVGKLSTDLLAKQPESRDPIELQREMTKSYIEELTSCVLSFRKNFPRDFFVAVLTKKERLMKNVIRNYFTPRLSCPSPEYDQAVYHYHHNEEALEFLWVLPSKDTCELFMLDADQVVPEERELLYFVQSLYNGNLLKLSKRLNKEN